MKRISPLITQSSFSLFFIILLVSSLSCTSENPEPPTASGPNIIFILIDDQRYDFLSFKNHPWLETPNIDRLAENSVYFDRAYVTTSLCSPSRASIVTGQYAHTHRVLDNDTAIQPGTPTFPQVLQDGGYHTGFVGKWHMGGSNDMPRPGFDYWASFKGQGPYTDPEMNINGERIPYEGYTPDILTELSIDFIKSRQENEQPYMLYLSHKSIHEPFTPAPRHAGRYSTTEITQPYTLEQSEGKPQWLIDQRKSWHGAERDYDIYGDYGDYDTFFRRYSECMLGVDESVGAIVDVLEELGQLEDTVIIYYSDNGYMMGEHGLIDKRVMYEESIRVPAFVHWPDGTSGARMDDRFILTVDIGPTILDMAGLPAPESMYGNSFLPLVQGEEVSWRDAFVYEYFMDPQAVQTPTIFGLRTEKYSYMTYHGVWDLFELYDMEADPKQLSNLVGGVKYGHAYGPFLRHLGNQDPDTYAIAKALDDSLTAHLHRIDGSRQPRWVQ
ncbi:MAG: sulfatase [Rhodothermaceae bacterium]|nr:sulfatase [Rhodothermaceae bacterium]